MRLTLPLILLLTPACNPCADAPGCLLAEGLSPALLSVRAPAADDVWITGASPDDGTGPVALNYDGDAWTRLDTSAWAGAELWWSHTTDDAVVLVGNQGLILELDRASGALEAVDGPDAEIDFFGVWGADDTLWAVGQTDGGLGPPALWQRSGGAWAAFGDPGDDGAVYFKVHGTAADDAWIVGNGGTALHWDGAAFTRVPTDADVDTTNAPLLTVDAGGERPIAVGGQGNGLILEYDGSAWRDVSPAFEPGFNGVCAGAGLAWAVGQHGARSTREGGAWISDYTQEVEALTLEDWHGCALDPDGGLWTVGGQLTSRPLTRGVAGYQGPGKVPGVTLE
ncbi:MAG: hypothetical protein H6739_14875 [Alphaproteobacteria bacterium]|nr:hypothetical protein [Alphaproteobacteria bacterium]